jgi:hypothetical protein
LEHLKGASIGWTPALPANIRLGWKGFPRTNALAYYKKARRLKNHMLTREQFRK